MKIANWNLERILPSQSRAKSIREYMAMVDADIWILTETHELLPPGDGFSGVFSGEPDQAAPGERWVGIWSPHAMEPLTTFVSDEERCAAALIRHPKLGDIVVFGCVLPWVGSAWRSIDYKDGACQRAEWNLDR